MFQIKISIFQSRKASIIEDDDIPTIGKGTRVAVNTLCYGAQVGIVHAVVISPYYGEESTYRAYVIGEHGNWSDYILIDDLMLLSDVGECTACDRFVPIELQCPECGDCLACCDCPTENADDLLDVDGYQPPRFMWMGRLFPSEGNLENLD